MKNKDHNECPFSHEIVSYMYGEMPDGAQLDFEQHLSACQVCTDDFAAVSVGRFEAYDWKKVEFDPLTTPKIVIPYPEKVASLGQRVSAWLSWVTVVPVAAAVVVGLSVSYFLLVDRNGKETIATLPSVATTTQPQTSSSANPGSDPVSSSVVASGNQNGNSSSKVVRVSFKKRPALPKSQVARRLVPNMKLANDVATNISPDQPKRSPRLGMYDEEDDRSLRLADLFDDTNPPPQR